MNCDWEIIGEKVFSFYEEMEYRSESSEYTVEQFKADLEIEKKKELPLEFRRSDIHSDEESINLHWILKFRKVLDHRRSIVTKLFSFGNNLRKVDTLVEYCDYYTAHHIVDHPFTSDISRIIRSIYGFLAVNNTTGIQLCENVWNMLEKDMGESSESWGSGSNEYFDHRFGIVIMADSDLNAAVQALVTSQNSFFGVSRVLVQEPVKEKLLNLIRNHEYKSEILANLFVFRNVGEALIDLNGYKKFKAISVWSEDIIAAKKIAADIEISTIWINTHGDLSPGLRSIIYFAPFFRKKLWECSREIEEHDSSSQTFPEIIRTINLFYGGKWEVPTEGEYWTDQSGISFARATERDFHKCATIARKAFKLWCATKLGQRAKVIKCFAERLRAHGQSEYADLISQRANPQLLEHGNSLSIARDGEVEITSTSRPVGVIAIASENQKTLLKKLTIATLSGNTVILVINSEDTKVSFAPYCEMLASCGFPPGVVNCLFMTNGQSHLELDETIADRVLGYSTDIFDDSDQILRFVTKLKSVWLQCG